MFFIVLYLFSSAPLPEVNKRKSICLDSAFNKSTTKESQIFTTGDYGQLQRCEKKKRKLNIK